MPGLRLALRVLCVAAICAMALACQIRITTETTEGEEDTQGADLEEQPLPTAVSYGAIEVIRPDGSAMWLTLAAVQKMPPVTATIQGQAEQGPPLLVILQTARVGEFTRVTVIGQGSNTLTRDQVTPDTLLVFSPQGSLRLAAPHLPREDWAQDVITLQAE